MVVVKKGLEAYRSMIICTPHPVIIVTITVMLVVSIYAACPWLIDAQTEVAHADPEHVTVQYIEELLLMEYPGVRKKGIDSQALYCMSQWAVSPCFFSP